MAEDAPVNTSVRTCQASSGNNSISSHDLSISVTQNVKEQIPKYQVMFVTFLVFISFTEEVHIKRL